MEVRADLLEARSECLGGRPVDPTDRIAQVLPRPLEVVALLREKPETLLFFLVLLLGEQVDGPQARQ